MLVSTRMDRSDYSSGATAGDWNGDGWMDIFVANEGEDGEHNEILMNDGTGSFISTLTDRSDSSRGATAGDWNGDGWMDIFVANANGGHNQILMNDGTGSFNSTLTDRSDTSSGATAGDWTGDGWMDLFVANAYGGHNEILMNDGTGSLISTLMDIYTMYRTSSAGATAGDWNGDGWMDIFVANSGYAEFGDVYLGECEILMASGCTIDSEAGTIAGNLEVHDESITEIHLNALTAIGGELRITHSPLLSHIDFGALSNVTRVKMEGLPAVSALEWVALTRVCDDLNIEQMETLSSISFPNLVSVGDHLVVGAAPVLSSFVAPSLQSVGFFVAFMGTPMYGVTGEMCGASCEVIRLAACELDSDRLFDHMYHENQGQAGNWTDPPNAETFDGLCSGDGAACTDTNGDHFGTYAAGVERCASATTMDECRGTPFCDDRHDETVCTAPAWAHEQGCPLEVPGSLQVIFAQGLGADPLPWPSSTGADKDALCYEGVVGLCSDPMGLIDCSEAGQHRFASAQFGNDGEHAAKWRGRVALCCALPVSIDCGPAVVRQMLAVCETMGVRNCTC